jgi:hypothetical protein
MLAGVAFSMAMVVSAVVTCCGLALAVRSTGVGDTFPAERGSLLTSMYATYQRSLVGTALLDVLIMRLPYLIAAAIASPAGAGAFAALLGTQQALGSVVTTGHVTVMAARSQNLTSAEEVIARRNERFLAAASWIIAAAGIVATPLVLRLLAITDIPGAAWWWIALACALPVLGRNRARQYRLMAVSSVVVGAVAVVEGSLTVLAHGSIIGEAAAIVALAVAAAVRNGSAQSSRRRSVGA